ncbi:P-loop NTPase fold protein [Lentzea nigeriaca]|uniref:P-loop NTPase fold protein n=1 Tax=Lentzea nigeriaca TaxID=1128665 RepID=UPI00195BC41E|nr:P-loop NTPase fold protein [Lentzea nigeriaca]MBM7857326.1 nucleoside-triphosphatase THEP1 [Lentzea nigeriaca]
MPDTPTSDDELGFDRFAIPLARTIAATDRSTTPWTIGVYGEWGSGKTTFLKLVEKALEPSGVRPIWFNAWKYARDDNLWAALIEKIVRDARRSVRWYRVPDVRLRIWLRSIDFGAGLWELFRKLLAVGFKIAMLTVLILMAISLVPVAGNPVTGWLADSSLLAEPWSRALVGVIAALGTKPEALLKLFDVKLGADLGAFRRRQLHRSQTALLDDFTAEFQGVLAVVYRKKPLVVIIDDLDRCLPEQTLQIIETVKLFLDEPGCVFLLAVDRDVIEHAIRVKYKDLPSVGELGETFFEKIVQLPYSLPPPADGRVESYIRSISSDPDVLSCLPILRGTPPYNPRRIKRSVQAFTLLKELFAADQEPVPPVLAKLVVLQAQFRQVYRAAVNDHSLLARLEQAYRQPDGNVDGALSAQIDRFSTLYPGLASLFNVRLGDRDTFSAVAVETYLSIVDTVTATDEPSPPVQRTALVICMRRDWDWGEQIANVVRSTGRHVVVTTPGYNRDASYELSIIVWSTASAEALSAERVVTAATMSGEPLVVVKVDGGEPPAELARRGYLDVAGLTPTEMRDAVLSRIPYVPLGWGESGPQTITNLPMVPGGLVPRDELLNGVTAPITALVGMPGSGKTTLALQYARSRLADFRVVWLIRAATRHEDIAALAKRLSVTPDRAIGQLALTGRYLLIYDGFGANAIAAIRHPADNGMIIVTSRDRVWDVHAAMVEVGPFSRAESVAFLGVPEADVLAEALGDLPLALACAKEDLFGSGRSVDDYLRALAEQGTAVVRYDNLSLSAALSDAFERLAEIGSRSLAVLQAMAMLGSPPIPRELVMSMVRGKEMEFDRAVTGLVRMSLVELVSGDFDVNPVVRRFALESPEALRYLKPVNELPVSVDQQQLERLQPHWEALVAHAPPAVAAELLLRIGHGWLAAGSWVKARVCAEKALELDRDNAEVGELRALATGFTVLLLGYPSDEMTAFAKVLRAGFGKEPFEVVGADPIKYLITSVIPVDCVVAIDDGAPTMMVKEHASVARSIGVRHAVAAGLHEVPSLGLLADDFPNAPTVRVDSGEKVLELADLIQQQVREPWIEDDPTECTQFRAVLMACEGQTLQSVNISFGFWKGSASVLGMFTGTSSGTTIVLFEVSKPVSIMAGSRFGSTLGRGVVTRIVK